MVFATIHPWRLSGNLALSSPPKMLSPNFPFPEVFRDEPTAFPMGDRHDSLPTMRKEATQRY
jgi:hypothetical protein